MFTLALIIYVSGELWEFPMPSMKACWSLRQRSTFVEKIEQVEPSRFIYCIPIGAGWLQQPETETEPYLVQPDQLRIWK